MSEAFDYCSKCGDNCCTPVRGLKVTRPEFERVFADHEASLETVDRGAYLEVSSNAAGACPHFKDGACSIYDRRPAECRLFPYTVETIEERGDTVRAFVHGGPIAPSSRRCCQVQRKQERLSRVS